MAEMLSYGEFMDWQTLSPEELEREYSPSQFGKRPLVQYLEEYHQLSQGHNQELLHTSEQPLLIYIHGGYWQRLSASDSLFNAEDAIREGVSLHAVEYTLAPQATIDEMVSECIADIISIIQNLRPTRTVIAGSSAGAHLVAMCIRETLVSNSIDAVVLLSGIYDIRPLVHTATNEPLHLTEESAAMLSPILLPPKSGVRKALCAVGEFESEQFKIQNEKFFNFLSNQGCDASTLIVDGRDHFDIPYDLLRRETAVGKWTLQQLKDETA